MNDPLNDHVNDPDSNPDRDRRQAREGNQARAEEVAMRIGTALGRLARRVAASAGPEVERRAKQARTAAEAARPHIEHAAAQTRDYVQAHDEEIKRVAQAGARIAVSRVVPPSLRPIVDAAEQKLHGDEPPAGPKPDEPLRRG